MRGRKPKPTEMKRLAGNPGKRPLTGNTPPAWAKAPRPPKHLGKAARAEWKRMLAELERLGIAASCDRAALALYCQVYQRWVTAEERLAKQSLVLEGADGGGKGEGAGRGSASAESGEGWRADFGTAIAVS